MKYTYALLAFVAGMATTFAGTMTAQNLFRDVPTGQYFTEPANNLARQGVLTGYQDGSFAPYDPVNRAQLATAIHRYDQNVVESLRRRIIALERGVSVDMDSGTVCGNGVRESGEQCDDGNTTPGDGCSAHCVRETFDRCPDGHRIGERFRAPDGCNWCECDERGIMSCTEMACDLSGDSCGNGICEDHERTCPSNCRIDGRGRPVGNCSCIVLCDADCSDDHRTCEGQKDIIRDFLAEEADRECRSDRDCEVYVQRCPPVTCGASVHAEIHEKLRTLSTTLVNTCKEDGPVACKSCPSAGEAVCRAGRCVLE